MCLVFKIPACPFGQVKTKMYLPKSPFFKKSLAGASGLVLMSVPERPHHVNIACCPLVCSIVSGVGRFSI